MQDLPLNQIIIVGAVVVLYGLWMFNGMRKKQAVKAALAAGARVIDVRSPAEFGSGHYTGAINIPHDKIGDRLKAVGSTDETIILYCASGARSSMAAATLKAKGYAKVINAGRLGAMPV